MLLIFIAGVIVGVLIVVTLLRLTMKTNPKSCFIFLASLIFLVCWTIGLVLLTL
jgi:hypothetical protein